LRQAAGSAGFPAAAPGADEDNHEVGGRSMRKLLGRLVPCAVLGVLLLTAGVGEAKAAFVFEITVTITDNTTHTTTTFGPIDSTGPNNAVTGAGQQTTFQVLPAFDTSASGVALSGLIATSNNPGSTNGTLRITGTGQVVPGSSDNYTVTITTSETGFTSPSGAAGTLTASHSNTVTSTTAATTLYFASYFPPTTTINDTTHTHATASTIIVPATGLGSNLSGSSPTASTIFSPFVTPYALTNVLSFTLSGNGTGSTGVNTNSSNQFTGSTVVSVVPEPASLVVFLTGMPLPLAVVLGLMRRRRGVVAG
jgi:hypothetical protein